MRLPANGCLVETSRGQATIRFWHRQPGQHVSGANGNAWYWGFVTGRLVDAPVAPEDYQRVCRTSHFGDAHFEAAFRYRPGECRIFAVKNVARDYCGWVNRISLVDRLSFGSRRAEAVELFQAFARVLAEHFEAVSLDPPSVCVELAVQPELLAGDQHLALVRMFQRYQQLQTDLAEQEHSRNCHDLDGP